MKKYTAVQYLRQIFQIWVFPDLKLIPLFFPWNFRFLVAMTRAKKKRNYSIIAQFLVRKHVYSSGKLMKKARHLAKTVEETLRNTKNVVSNFGTGVNPFHPGAAF